MIDLSQSPYLRPQQLIAILGSFWTRVFADRAQLAAVGEAKCLVERQTQLQLSELLEALSRTTMPVFREQEFYPIELLESDLGRSVAAYRKYDLEGSYDSSWVYDQVDINQFVWPLTASSLVAGSLLVDRLLEPTVSLQQGLDFVIDATNNSILFRQNPFDMGLPVEDVVNSDGEVSDRRMTLWLCRAMFDADTLYRQLGYVVGIKLRSTIGYRQLLNVVFDSLVGGTSAFQLYAGLSVLTGIPCCLKDGEIVTDVGYDSYGRFVATDDNLYRLPMSSTISVSVGQMLRLGQFMSDDIDVYENLRGSDLGGLTALSLDEDYLASCLYGQLLFENRDVPLRVITNHPSQMTRLEFAVGGHPGSVARFFDELHDRGVAAAVAADDCGQSGLIRYPADSCSGEADVFRVRGTLAHLLDRRPNPIGEPGPQHLPRTINPMRFLLDNLLHNNLRVVKIRLTGSVGQYGLGLHHLRYLTQLMPPRSALLVVVELVPSAETITLSGVEDAASLFPAVEPRIDSLSRSRLTETRLNIRPVNGWC